MLTRAATIMLTIWCLIAMAFLSYASSDIFWNVVKIIALMFYIPFLLLEGSNS